MASERFMQKYYGSSGYVKPAPQAEGFKEWKKRYGKTDDFLTGDVWEVAKAAWSAAQPKPTPQKYEHELENLKVELELLKQKHEVELSLIRAKYRNLQDFCAGLSVRRKYIRGM